MACQCFRRTKGPIRPESGSDNVIAKGISVTFQAFLEIFKSRRWFATINWLTINGLWLGGSAVLVLSVRPVGGAGLDLGPLCDQFPLTIGSGYRTEVAGPAFYHQLDDSTRLWAAPPIFSYTLDEVTDFEEFDFLYPLITYDRFGPEKRIQIMQVLNLIGSRTLLETNVHRFTIFPFFFLQRSEDPAKNYAALLPIYGQLQNRLFRDEVNFVLMPLYVQTRKRDVVTYNTPYPFIHYRYGIGLKGWQFWPLVGHEHKEVTSKTNIWDELEVVPGHDKFFAAWPIFFKHKLAVGSENPEWHHAVLPLYSMMRSPLRDSTSVPFLVGVTYTIDRAKKFKEVGAPWPLVVFARGEGKTTSRIWPLFSQSHNETLESNWYLWPVYKFNGVKSAPLERRRTRLLLFLYSDLVEKNTETGQALRRKDLWPLYTSRRDLNGDYKLQVLSILEPILPNNKSVERNYSPLWSVWRAQRNAKTGATSQSLLWNLYRHETTPVTKKCSLLFGLFKYQSNADGKRWRVFYVPFGRASNGPAADRSGAE